MRRFVLLNVDWESESVSQTYVDLNEIIGCRRWFLGIPGPPSIGVNYGTQLMLSSGENVMWAREWDSDWRIALHLLAWKIVW